MTTLYKPLNALVTNCVPACAFSPPLPRPGLPPCRPARGSPPPAPIPPACGPILMRGRTAALAEGTKFIEHKASSVPA